MKPLQKDKKAVIYLFYMVTIEYNGESVDVPESWDEIKVGDYEKYHNERPETSRGRVELVAKICKVEAETLFNWPAEIFNLVVERVEFIFKNSAAEPTPSIKIDGVTYLIPIEEKLSLGAYIDADEVQKSGEAVISNILAIVCRPVNEEYNYENNEARAAMFAALPVSKVRGLLAFFLLCSRALEKHTTAFTNLTEAVASLPPSIEVFRSPGGGIKLFRIWPTIKYYYLTILLSWRLRKLSRFYNTAGTKKRQKRRRGS